MQPRQSPERNLRFQQFRATRPRVSLKEIAEFLDRSRKTVNMWNNGFPGSIPMDTIRLLELSFPATNVVDDADLIG